MGRYGRYPLLGHAVHRSGDNGQVLHRRGNPQVFGEEHRRLRNRDGRDFGSYERDSAGAGIGKHFPIREGRDLAREVHDVVVGGHVFHGQVFSTVSHEHIALVFNKIGVGTVVQCSEFLDVRILHVDAFYQRMSADDSGVKRRQEVDGLLVNLKNKGVLR